MTGKENSAMTILMDFAKPCKGKLIGSVVLAVLGALCGMIPYIAVSRGIISHQYDLSIQHAGERGSRGGAESIPQYRVFPYLERSHREL